MYWGVFNAHVGLKPRPTGVTVFGDVDHEWVTYRVVVFGYVDHKWATYGWCRLCRLWCGLCRSVFRPTKGVARRDLGRAAAGLGAYRILWVMRPLSRV